MNDIAMIAADTSRSRVYIQSLIRNNLLPNFVLLLADRDGKLLPGQIDINNYKNNNLKIKKGNDNWSEVNSNLFEPVKETLKNSSIEFKQLKTENIHDSEVINHIAERPESIFIYSGFGGVILRKELFLTSKKFLHVHGGYLPDYKGSTTNYYSLIIDGIIGASAIFLNEHIDSGPLLRRKKFPAPKEKDKIDHIYDNAARAKVLIETLKEYEISGKFDTHKNLEKGENYFIIHPILKHIAIIGK